MLALITKRDLTFAAFMKISPRLSLVHWGGNFIIMIFCMTLFLASGLYNRKNLQRIYYGLCCLIFGSYFAAEFFNTLVFDRIPFPGWKSTLTTLTDCGILFTLVTIGLLMLIYALSLRHAVLPGQELAWEMRQSELERRYAGKLHGWNDSEFAALKKW